MRVKGYAVFLIISLYAARSPAYAEERAVVRFESLSVRDVDIDEARMIEELLLFYLSDMGDFIVYRNPDVMGDAEPDYILNGTLSVEGDNHVISLALSMRETDQIVKRTSTYRNSGDVALNLRSLLKACFASDPHIRRAEDDGALPLKPSAVAGTWRAGGSIEFVRIDRNGGATAYYISGAIMKISYQIDDDALILTQESPNNYRFYYPLPADIAAKVAAVASPMRWSFSLYDGGKTLRGTVSMPAVERDKKGKRRIRQSVIKKVEWGKVSF